MALAATLAYLAIIGVLAWRAWRGGDTEKVMFFVNVVLLWASAIWFFGYPALIGPAVVAAGGILLLLVALTSSDFLSRAPVEPKANPQEKEGASPTAQAGTPAKAKAADGRPVRSATASS